MTRFGRLRDGLMLMGIVMALLGGMALAMAAGLFVGGADEAKAQAVVGQITVNKSDTGDGEYIRGETFDWWVSFSVSSQTSETFQFNDLLPTGVGLNFINLSPTSQGMGCSAGVVDDILCTVSQGTLPQTFYLQVNVTVDAQAACGTITNSVLTGPVAGSGTMVAEDDVSIAGCPTQAAFQLCKDWDSNGVLNSGPRTFLFDVSDISQTRQIPIEGVTEGGPPVCVTVQAPEGPIDVDEVEVAGFDTPEYWYNGSFQFASTGPFNFLLQDTFCALPIVTGTALLQEQNPFHSCVITVVNEDNDVATTTPTIVVCPRCNTVTATVPPPTSTPTPPPATATQPPPTATQPPPTATPTSISGGTGGLTDAQRTQTAVAAARTAAAQQTPLPPRTGLGGADGGAGGGTGVNIALFAIGLVVLSGGLGLVAVRSRR